MLPDRPGVYAIELIATGRRYIGNSRNVRNRLRAHFRLLCRSCHQNKVLQDEWNRYGHLAFHFSMLEVVTDPRERMKAEERHILATPSDLRYNVRTCVVKDIELVPTPPRVFETSHGDDDMLTISEVADLLGCRPATVWLLAKTYDLARFRIPGHGKQTYLRWGDVLTASQTPRQINKKQEDDDANG